MFVRGMFKYTLLLCGFTILVLLTKILENKMGSRNLIVFSADDEESSHMTSNTYNDDQQLTGSLNHNMKKLKGNIQQKPRHLYIRENIAKESPDLPTIFAITPTYKRFLQKAELTRVSQTFRLVKNFHWILVEDSKDKTSLVRNFLERCGLRYTHLNIRTPKQMRRSRRQPRWTKSRGVEQRNLGLEWIRKHVNTNNTKGVVYFADDDNTYDVRIFEEMRTIKGVGVWPVAFTGVARWSGPVCKHGKVLSFHSNWKPWRNFPLDMAGFAINIRKLVIEYPEATFEPQVRPGLMETSFLEQITTREDMEPKADHCMKVYVWHTRTELPIININGERQLIKRGHPSNPLIET